MNHDNPWACDHCRTVTTRRVTAGTGTYAGARTLRRRTTVPDDPNLTAQVPEQNVCSRCNMPVIQTARGWEHAEAADAVFCQLVMAAGMSREVDDA